MGIPVGLLEEAGKLRRGGPGTWRWWLTRSLASLFVLVIYMVNTPGPGNWAVALGLLLGQMLIFWAMAQLVAGEQTRIVRKLPRGAKGVLLGGMPGLAIYWVLKAVTPAGSMSRAGSYAAFLWVFVIVVILLEQAEAAKRASFDLLDAREQALRAKLAPHFIFNTLNTLHAQIEQDPRGAQATTERLAQLFRQVIAASDQLTIPLRQELGFVEAYLGIEQARLGERLKVSVEIPEELEAAEVPPLSLQVLVENAVKHGVAPLEAGGEIRLGADKKAGFLHLWVEDPGPGFSQEKGTGTALETLRQRLESASDLEMGMVDGRHRVGFRWREGSRS